MNYKEILDEVLKKLERTIPQIKDSLAHMAQDGEYGDESNNPRWWTNGFWPGILWLVYRETGDEKILEYASSAEAKLDVVLDKFYEIDHDLGFMWGLSSVASYKITGNEVSKLRGLKAASFLASRFNLAGNFIRAWNNEERTGWAIIDCMMNLPLLYWASKELDDKRFYHIAVAYTKTVQKYFINEDGSSKHVVMFDPDTGEYIDNIAGQGYSKESAWARGCAWALYGFALAYKYTNNKDFLETAKKCAEFFVGNLPGGGVPYADFKADIELPLDSTAGACAASGLALLGKLTGDDKYRQQSIKLIEDIYRLCKASDSSQAIIKHGNVAARAKPPLDDISIIYGDYFMLEALLQLEGREGLF